MSAIDVRAIDVSYWLHTILKDLFQQLCN